MRVLIVDDEPIARDGLARLVGRIPWCEVAGTHASAAAATRACLESKPDVLLLDIEMPGDDGLSVLRALPAAERPYTILVTAFDEYALAAYELGVRDYVLKPIDTRRLNGALERAVHAVGERRLARLGSQVRSLSAHPTEAAAERLIVRDAGRMRVVPLDGVAWIEADGYHARVHAGGKTYLLRESLDSLDDRLPPGRFVRSHRSSIINVAQAVELRARRDGSRVAVLTGGVEVEVSRRRLPAVRAALGRLDLSS
jgi:two-component system LytT family response regulator